MFGSEFLECQNLWKSNLAVTWDQVYHSVKASSVRSVNQYSWLTSWLTLGQHSIKTWSALNQQMCSSWLQIFCNMNSPSKNQDITEQEIWTWRFCDKALHIATITFFINVPILYLHMASSQVELEIITEIHFILEDV